MHTLRWTLLLLLCGGAVPAQDLLWRLEGNGSLIGRGREIQRLGDANGDGWEDLIEWGVLYDATSPWLSRNAIFVTSGRDGTVLTASPPLPVWSQTFQSLSLAPMGDMDQDGVPDYAVTVYDAAFPYNTLHVQVRSGANHVVLWTVTIPNPENAWYGFSLAGEMDLDGDGLGDLVVNATQFSPNGTIFVYDHFGNERYRLIDSVPGVLTGTDLASLGGDLDGDGCDDFLSAGPDAQNRGAVVVFSGRTGAALRVSHGIQNGDKLSFATGCGDMDGDGVLDYAGGGFWGASVVTAFSGATGQPIHTWRAPNYPYMGANVFGGFDLDQDGVNDLVAGSDGTAVHALSGRDGTFLWTYPGNYEIGLFQTMLAPPPGESYPLMVYSQRTWVSITNPATVILPGLLWAYRGCPRGVRTFGQPDAAPGLVLPRIGMRDLPGPAVRITLSDAPPATPAFLVFGLSDTNHGALALPAPLDAFGMPGLTLLTSAEAILPSWSGPTGYAKLDFNLPPGNALGPAGVPLFAQWFWLDPLNLAVGGSTAGQRFFVQ